MGLDQLVRQLGRLVVVVFVAMKDYVDVTIMHLLAFISLSFYTTTLGFSCMSNTRQAELATCEWDMRNDVAIRSDLYDFAHALQLWLFEGIYISGIIWHPNIIQRDKLI